MTDAFWSEVMGTGLLVLLGAGVVANVILPKNKGFDGGWLLINFGWGFAVMAGVYASFKSGAYLNPAVVIGTWASGARRVRHRASPSPRPTASTTSPQRCSAPR